MAKFRAAGRTEGVVFIGRAQRRPRCWPVVSMDRALDWRSPSPGEPGGLVQLHRIDLKGGMELSMGRPLFTRYAQSAEYAVALLADDARSLQERAERLSGRTRQHTPDATEPLVVIVIDELAALIAYQRTAS